MINNNNSQNNQNFNNNNLDNFYSQINYQINPNLNEIMKFLTILKLKKQVAFLVELKLLGQHYLDMGMLACFVAFIIFSLLFIKIIDFIIRKY